MCGFHGSEDTEAYCPFCKKTTPQWIEWDEEERAQLCDECENEVSNIPQVTIGEPFLIGNNLYLIHFGNDDEISLLRYDDK